MRICRLSWVFPRQSELAHGLEPNIYYISREQAKLGHDVHVVSLIKRREPRYEEIDDVKVHRVFPPYNLNTMRKIGEIHKDKPISVVHSHGTCGIAYPFFRRHIRSPLVVHVHGTTLELRRRYAEARAGDRKALSLRETSSILRQRVFWRRADLVIAVSEGVRRELVNLYKIDPTKIVVVYNGFDPSLFKPASDPTIPKELGLSGRHLILYVGHFGPNKGLSVLLEAMPKILERIPSAYILCIGGTPKWLGTNTYWDTLTRIIRKNQLENAVKLMGEVQHQVLNRYYSLADVFVLPSYYEALGKVILEAMACGAPVVATKTGGIPEIVKNGVNGLLVSPGNPSELAESVITLLENKNLARRLAEEGRKMVVSSFTWEQTARNLIEAYKKIP